MRKSDLPVIFLTSKEEEIDEQLTPGLECVHFNAHHNFTLQYPLQLATLRVDDDEPTAIRKIRVVAVYVDILINRRIWNWRAIDYSTMQFAMFVVMRDIRAMNVADLAITLRQKLDAESETFSSNDRFRLHGMNGRQIHRVLARMIDYIETRSGLESRYDEYAQRGRKGYEIEHIWANHPEWHGDEKREHYLGQGGNLLARSLYETTYDHNPGFKRFIQESGLPFRLHAEFKKADLDDRQRLYQKLADQIWSPARLEQEAST
jgi:hypothetical protein